MYPPAMYLPTLHRWPGQVPLSRRRGQGWRVQGPKFQAGGQRHHTMAHTQGMLMKCSLIPPTRSLFEPKCIKI